MAQMEELPEFIHRKQKNYGLHNNCCRSFSGGTLLSFREDSRTSGFILKPDMEHREKHERCDYNVRSAVCRPG